MKYNNIYCKTIFSVFVNKLHDIMCFIYPPKCLICDSDYLKDRNSLCDECFSKIELIYEPVCCNCGDILSIRNSQLAYGNICVLCAKNPPNFCRFVSPLYYNHVIAELISKFKYQDKQELAKYLSTILVYAFVSAEYNDIDFIVPLPVSYLKLLKRKYNQVLLLANNLSAYINVPVKYNLLLKSRNTKPQASQNLLQRKQNVYNSFHIHKKWYEFIKNKTILLIDDIVTTGNTINEASKTLKLAGAKKIYVLSLARVKGRFHIY